MASQTQAAGREVPVDHTTDAGRVHSARLYEGGPVLHHVDFSPVTAPLSGVTLKRGSVRVDPTHGLGVGFGYADQDAAVKARLKKGQGVFFKAAGGEGARLRPLVEEAQRRETADRAESDRKREGERQRDAALVSDMHRKAGEFRAQIPAGNVPVVLREKFRDSDGDPYYSYEADGVTLEGAEKDLLVHHGSAHAIRPGATNSFTSEHVYSIPRADLERVRAAQQARRAEKEGKDAARKAEADTRRRNAFAEARSIGKPVVIRTWSESVDDPENENSLDIVSETAMPDGTTTTRRSPTH